MGTYENQKIIHFCLPYIKFLFVVVLSRLQKSRPRVFRVKLLEIVSYFPTNPRSSTYWRRVRCVFYTLGDAGGLHLQYPLSTEPTNTAQRLTRSTVDWGLWTCA